MKILLSFVKKKLIKIFGQNFKYLQLFIFKLHKKKKTKLALLKIEFT